MLSTPVKEWMDDVRYAYIGRPRAYEGRDFVEDWIGKAIIHNKKEAFAELLELYKWYNMDWVLRVSYLQGVYYETLLHRASRLGRVWMCELLIDEGCPLNILDRNAATALDEARYMGFSDLCDSLLSHGFKYGSPLNRLHTSGFTSNSEHRTYMDDFDEMLCSDVLAHDSEGDMVLRALGHWDESFGEINSHFSRGSTPLHMAVACDSAKGAQRLIEMGAGIDSPANGGVTPLHDAVWYRADKCVRLLIEHGANPHLKDALGESAISLAERLILEMESRNGSQRVNDADGNRAEQRKLLYKKRRIIYDYLIGRNGAG